MKLPPTINLHVTYKCNYDCTFCFANFWSAQGLPLPTLEEWKQMIGELPTLGVTKVNFAGGEPTIFKGLSHLIKHAKACGLTTSIVTNGTRLEELLNELDGELDIIALSIDSAKEDVNKALGRGKGKHVEQTRRLAALIHEKGIRLKINTVVTSLAVDEDMSELLLELKPERWKIFQVLPITGENNGKVEPLLVSSEAFTAFFTRHQHLDGQGIKVVPESNSQMTGSYGMMDPAGRFFDNSTGALRYSEPALKVGLEAAFASVDFSSDKFDERGGRYA